ncbi:MAG: FAD-dependent oxidoreductase, partial [Dehalococcoidia bacterium]
MTPPVPARVDVCIAGGGIVGLALARELALRGRSVAVLEAARVGERAAAGVAAGMLAPASEADLSDSRITPFALAAHAGYDEWAASLEQETGVEVGYDATGTLLVALHHDHLALLDHLHAFQRDRGLQAERLTAGEARAAEPYLAPTIAGGLRTADAQVDPRRVLRALAVALERSGATLLEGARVTGLSGDGEDYEVIYERDGEPASLRAAQVVVAAGAWSRQIASA